MMTGMKIVGIECATKEDRMGLALGTLKGNEIIINEVELGSSDTSSVGIILNWLSLEKTALLALDAPLGWPEFTAKAARRWLSRVGVKTLFIEPGSPWENGYIESFNGKLRDELLKRDVFCTLPQAKVFIDQRIKVYIQIRPHSSIGYLPPAPEAKILVTLT